MTTAHDYYKFNLPDIHRGLTNQIGENNCFLNVTIQALWHLGPFRVEIQKFIANIEAGKTNHQRLTPGSLLESMCNLFVQYEFTDQKVLPPNELRESLCQLSGKFEFGKIADANETLDTILHRIHTEQSATCPQMRKCLSHKVFGGLVMEQTICSECRGSSEPTLRDDFITCFQALELISEAKELLRIRTMLKPYPERKEAKESKDQRRSVVRMPNLFGKKSQDSSPMTAGIKSPGSYHAEEHADPPISGMEPHDFGSLLHRCMEVGQRSCPANDDPGRPSDQPLCKGKGKVCFFSLEPPLALALSVGWTQANEEARTLRDFYATISDTIQLSDLFSGEGGIGIAPNGPTYTFRGLVCYYGLHYVSIFQEMGRERFLLFDDQKVRVIGDWAAVKEECVKSKYQPVLLLYELNKTTAYMTNTESDDELELVMSEKARVSKKAQKVRIENDSKCTISEDMEVESKTGDPFVVLSPDASSPSSSVSSATGGPAAVATLFEAPSSLESNLIDLSASPPPSVEAKVGPFSSEATVKQAGEVKLSEGKPSAPPAPRFIAAVPIVNETPYSHSSSQAKQSIGNYASQSSGPFSGSSTAPVTASVVSGTNTTFDRDMFAPQEDTHMSSLIAPPSIGARAEPKHPTSSSTASHGSGSSSSSHHSAQPPSLQHPHQTPAHGAHSHGHGHGSSVSGTKPNIFAELKSSASQSLLQGLHLAPQQQPQVHPVITKWSHRPLRYNVVLGQELVGNGQKSVGVNVAPGSDGKPVVTGFFKHPLTNMALPAERSGLISLGDRIVTINDIELREYDLDLLRTVLTSCDTVTFTMASHKLRNLWYSCPRCGISNIVDQDVEARLKNFNSNRLMNEMKRGVIDQKGFPLRCVMCRSENIADTSIHD